MAKKNRITETLLHFWEHFLLNSKNSIILLDKELKSLRNMIATTLWATWNVELSQEDITIKDFDGGPIKDNCLHIGESIANIIISDTTEDLNSKTQKVREIFTTEGLIQAKATYYNIMTKNILESMNKRIERFQKANKTDEQKIIKDDTVLQEKNPTNCQIEKIWWDETIIIDDTTSTEQIDQKNIPTNLPHQEETIETYTSDPIEIIKQYYKNSLWTPDQTIIEDLLEPYKSKLKKSQERQEEVIEEFYKNIVYKNRAYIKKNNYMALSDQDHYQHIRQHIIDKIDILQKIFIDIIDNNQKIQYKQILKDFKSTITWKTIMQFKANLQEHRVQRNYEKLKYDIQQILQ
jgi:hypothetical protein